MAENVDYKRFRDNVPQYGDRLDRIENALVFGMPDINFCSGGREVWLEQKSPTEPVRAATPLFGSNHKVSQDQMNWFMRQRQAGGLCYFLITTNRRWLLVDGLHADNLNKMTLTDLIINGLFIANKPIRDKNEWKLLRAILRGEQ